VLRRLGLLGTLVLLLTACAPAAGTPQRNSGEAAAPARPQRTLVAALRVEPQSLAARRVGLGGVAIYLSNRLFNADLTILNDDGVAEPYLAEALPQLNTDSWRVFPDGRMETTYRLKPGLVWHDGAPLTSADFAFSHRVYATPELGPALPPINLIEEVATPDERTVLVRWKQPFAQAAALNSAGTGAPANFPPLPRVLLESAFDGSGAEAFLSHPWWTREFVGLGPYRLQRWEPGTFIEASGFERHVLGPPKIERIKMMVMPDNNATIAALLSGDVHLAPADANFPLGRLRGVMNDLGPGNGSAVLHPNQWRRGDVQLRPEYVGNRGLLDPRVRKALAHAIDKDAINEAVYDGHSMPSEIMVPPTSQLGRAVDAAIAKHPYDPRRSEELMVGAGFTRGADGVFTSPATGRFASEIKTNNGTDNVAEMSILASTWRQSGFDMQDAILPVALSQDAEARATFSGVFSANGNLEGALNFKSAVFPGTPNRFENESRGGWVNAEYGRLRDAWSIALDPAERTRVAVELARIFNDDLPAISLFFNSQPWVFVSALQGPRIVASESNVCWRIHEWDWK
jgi:peptide/nickel transport system substrate-binding protein